MSKLEQELQRIESHFVRAKIEYLHLFTPAGALVQQLRGKKDKVEIPIHIKLFGTVLTHNHPSGSDLSDKDCFLFLKRGILELRAYGKHGVYRLTVNDPKAHDSLDFKTIKALFGKKALKTYGEVGPKLVARLYGIKYEFIPIVDANGRWELAQVAE